MHANLMRGVVLTALVACQGAGPERAATVAPRLDLPAAIETVVPSETLALFVRDTTAERVTAELLYRPNEGQARPRAAEIQLALTGLELDKAEVGSAAQSAGKQLVVQTPAPGQLRLLLYGTASLDRVGPGALATLVLRRTGGPARLELLPAMPVFAPADANDGVRLGPVVELGGTP